MSVTIVGGHERMERVYKDICREYNCTARIFTKMRCNMNCSIGCPDLMVLFTNPVSHGLARTARKEATAMGIPLVQSHSGSGAALRGILAQACSKCKDCTAANKPCMASIIK
jgi:hypothetical protein